MEAHLKTRREASRCTYTSTNEKWSGNEEGLTVCSGQKSRRYLGPNTIHGLKEESKYVQTIMVSCRPSTVYGHSTPKYRKPPNHKRRLGAFSCNHHPAYPSFPPFRLLQRLNNAKPMKAIKAAVTPTLLPGLAAFSSPSSSPSSFPSLDPAPESSLPVSGCVLLAI